MKMDVAEQIEALRRICFFDQRAESMAPLRRISDGYVEMHKFRNAIDLVRSERWELMDNYCDVCFGHGRYKMEECWLCEGTGIDPSK